MLQSWGRGWLRNLTWIAILYSFSNLYFTLKTIFVLFLLIGTSWCIYLNPTKNSNLNNRSLCQVWESKNVLQEQSSTKLQDKLSDFYNTRYSVSIVTQEFPDNNKATNLSGCRIMKVLSTKFYHLHIQFIAVSWYIFSKS